MRNQALLRRGFHLDRKTEIIKLWQPSRWQRSLLDEAYRVVNGADVVARLPRSINFLLKIGYDHCGATALISLPKISRDGENLTGNKEKNTNDSVVPLIWVEGESDDASCPVCDSTP